MNVVVVHGSYVHSKGRASAAGAPRWWYADSPFSAAICAGVGPECRIEPFVWSGDNDHQARLTAGRLLANKLRRMHAHDPDSPIYVVGQSHGANVALTSINLVEPETVSGLFLLACPHMAVELESARPCQPVFEVGDASAPACGGSKRHWLYWGDVCHRVSGPIWNFYSPQDQVQTTLAGLVSGVPSKYRGWGPLRVRMARTYDGPGSERIHNGAVPWMPNKADTAYLRMRAQVGVTPHNAMRAVPIGRMIGLLIHEELPFETAMARAGLSTTRNAIGESGSPSPTNREIVRAAIPQYRAPVFDVNLPPCRVNMDPTQSKRPGVLLIHGLTAAPTEMMPLAQFLTDREPTWAIRCVQLAGHGTTYADLRQSNEEDWYESVQSAYDELKACAEPIYVAGLSVGGALACRLAEDKADDPIAGLVLLAPVFDLPWPKNQLLGLYGLFHDDVPKPPERAAYYEEHGLYSHMAFPVSGLQALRRNGRIAWEHLDRMNGPTLIIVGSQDEMATPALAEQLAKRLHSDRPAGGQAELMLAPKSGHILTVEPDAEAMMTKCYNFMKAHSAAH